MHNFKQTKRVKSHARYDSSLKREVARRYLAGEFSYRVAAEEYGLRSGEVVKHFVRWYRLQDDYLQPVEYTDNDEAITTQSGGEPAAETFSELTHVELLEQVRQLTDERDRAQLAAQGWRTMIEIAEQTLKVEIVKKCEAKPSAK